MPLSAKPPASVVATVWLRGLLPEGMARTRLAERAGADPDDALAFLAHYGRDTAGALVLVPQGFQLLGRWSSVVLGRTL